MSAALALVPEVVAGEFDAALDSDDLNYTPQLDVEAQTLCALLWASPEVARTVVDVLTASDFYRPVYGELFTVIARLVTEARPHSSVLVLSELQRGGKVSGQLSRALTEVTLADAREHEISHYARAVLAQSYRRGYATAAATLAQLAGEAGEDELFEQMCVLGRERRDAKARLDAAVQALA